MTCEHAASGCNAPESECLGLCMKGESMNSKQLKEMLAVAHQTSDLNGDALEETQAALTATLAEVVKMKYHLRILAEVADQAAMVLATIEAEDSTEEEKLQAIIDGINRLAPDALLEKVFAGETETEEALAASRAECARLKADNKAAWDTNRAIDKGRQEEMRRRDRAEADNRALRAFSNEIMGVWLEGGTWDGGDLQEIALKHGLIQPIERTEPCCENCTCAEASEFPLTCYIKSEILKPNEAAA